MLGKKRAAASPSGESVPPIFKFSRLNALRRAKLTASVPTSSCARLRRTQPQKVLTFYAFFYTIFAKAFATAFALSFRANALKFFDSRV